LTKTKQQSPYPKQKPVDELLEEAKRRNNEKKLFGSQDKSKIQDKGFKQQNSNKGFCSQREVGDNILFTKESPKNQIDDFKDYIDREYLNLKLQLENLRKCTKTKKFYENSSSSVESLSNLSGISTKNREPHEPLYSIISNPLISPQNSTSVYRKAENLKPKILNDSSGFEKFDSSSKAFDFEEKPNLNGILKTNDFKINPNSKKFTIESNNIEVFPETSRKLPASPKPKLTVYSANYSIPARHTTRSASNKKCPDNLFEKINKKHRKDKKSPAWKNNFLPMEFPTGYPTFQPQLLKFPHYPMESYPNSNKFPDEKHSENFQPFLKYRFNDEESNKNEYSEEDENYQTKCEKNEYSDKSENTLKLCDTEEKEKYHEKNKFELKESEVIPTFGKESSVISNEDLEFKGSSDSDHIELIKKEPVLLEIGENESKTLAQIFKERNRIAAENIKNRDENIVRKRYRAKSKKEIIEIRKNLFRGVSSKNCLPLPKSENKTIGEKRQKSQEIISRLVSGQRAKLSKKEMYELNKRNYKQP
jgi:hypothetical protein